MEIQGAGSGYNFAHLMNIENKKEQVEIKSLYTEKISADEAKAIREQVQMNALSYIFQSTSIQQNFFNPSEAFEQSMSDFQSFLRDIGYEGKPIAELSQEEAADLVSEEGFFGIEQTAQRIADFVINGAGGNEELLRAWREGMLQGFSEAEEIWGGKLPDISQETIKKATELVDKTMSDLGFSVIDTQA